MQDYFEQLANGSGISGDDVNRRTREKRLGFAAPSDDWADCKQIARCLWPGQLCDAIHLDGYYHNVPDWKYYSS